MCKYWVVFCDEILVGFIINNVDEIFSLTIIQLWVDFDEILAGFMTKNVDDILV